MFLDFSRCFSADPQRKRSDTDFPAREREATPIFLQRKRSDTDFPAEKEKRHRFSCCREREATPISLRGFESSGDVLPKLSEDGINRVMHQGASLCDGVVKQHHRAGRPFSSQAVCPPGFNLRLVPFVLSPFLFLFRMPTTTADARGPGGATTTASPTTGSSSTRGSGPACKDRRTDQRPTKTPGCWPRSDAQVESGRRIRFRRGRNSPTADRAGGRAGPPCRPTCYRRPNEGDNRSLRRPSRSAPQSPGRPLCRRNTR